MLAAPRALVFASDFGPMVSDMLIMVGVLAALAVLLALLTCAALLRSSRRKRLWMGVFAALWFLAILYGIKRWNKHQYESSREIPASTPFDSALEDPMPTNPEAIPAP
jgi:4-amino-4-deoxy-L-arabinose transferase-like glycosyltransferase